jgi:hypothetical protein
MMRPRQYSLSVISLLLLLLLSQAISFVFVAAKQKNTLRGLIETKEPEKLDELPTNDVSLTKDKLVKNNDKDSTESPSELPSSYPTQTPSKTEKEKNEKVDEGEDKWDSDIDPVEPLIAFSDFVATENPSSSNPIDASTIVSLTSNPSQSPVVPTAAALALTGSPVTSTEAPVLSTLALTANPTIASTTASPTIAPTDRPTAPPTDTAVVVTNTPTRAPTTANPTIAPTNRPTAPPTDTAVVVTNTSTRAPTNQTTINLTALLTENSITPPTTSLPTEVSVASTDVPVLATESTEASVVSTETSIVEPDSDPLIVSYDPTLWSLGDTIGKKINGTSIYMKSDGNLVVLGNDKELLWSSNTTSLEDQAVFTIDENGVIAVRLEGNILWAGGFMNTTTKQKSIGDTIECGYRVILESDTFLEKDVFKECYSGRYEVGLDESGDLVVRWKETTTNPTGTPTTISPTMRPSYKPTEKPTLTPFSSPIFEATPSPSIGARIIAATKLPTSISSLSPNTTASDNTEYLDFVVEEELPEIIIDMTVDSFTQTVNCTNKLEKYFIDFIESLLGMNNNNEWYSYHLKSVANISIELISNAYVGEDNNVLPAKKLSSSVVPVGFLPIPTPIRLIINGLVVVHFKEQEGEEEMPSKNDGGEMELNVADNTASSLKESLCHNMLMYMSFWGVEKIQHVLEEDDCFQNPVIDSIAVGEKEIPTVVIAGDSMYNDDNDSNRPKQPLLPGTIVDGSSSAVTVSSKFASVAIIMVSSGILILQY